MESDFWNAICLCVWMRASLTHKQTEFIHSRYLQVIHCMSVSGDWEMRARSSTAHNPAFQIALEVGEFVDSVDYLINFQTSPVWVL